jgi:hypothetical protein
MLADLTPRALAAKRQPMKSVLAQRKPVQRKRFASMNGFHAEGLPFWKTNPLTSLRNWRERIRGGLPGCF